MTAKPGAFTSEFLGTSAAEAAALWAAFDAPEWQVRCTAIAAFTILAALYALSRGRVKEAVAASAPAPKVTP